MRPEAYWSPRLGDVLSLRPCDLGDLTPMQLWQAHRYAHSDDD